MFTVDEMIDEKGKEGTDWAWAAFSNKFLFRPSVNCLIDEMKEELRKEELDVKMRIKRLDRDVSMEETNFTRLVKKNKSASHIRASAKLLNMKEIGRNRCLEIQTQLNLTIQELDQLKLVTDQQRKMIQMSNIYKKLTGGSRLRNMERMTDEYEINRESINDIRETFHEMWQSGPDFKDDESNVDKLILKKMEEKGLDLPEVPIFIDRPKKKSVEKEKLSNGGGTLVSKSGSKQDLSERKNEKKKKKNEELKGYDNSADLELYNRLLRLGGIPPDD